MLYGALRATAKPGGQHAAGCATGDSDKNGAATTPVPQLSLSDLVLTIAFLARTYVSKWNTWRFKVKHTS